MKDDKKPERNSNVFIKRVFGFSMASWVNCIISLIATPITTACFTPEELGKVNMLITYANVIIPFMYLGLDQAYVRFYNEPLGNNTAKSMFTLCCAFSAIMIVPITMITMFVWKPLSSGIIGYASFGIYVCLLIYVFASMLMRYANLKARMDNNVWLFFAQSVLSTVVIKLSFVGVALIQSSAEYAILFRSAMLLVVSLVFAFSAYKNCKKNPVDRSKQVTKELLQYSIPLFPTVFVAMLNVSLAQIVLKNYVAYEMIGIYSNAVTMANIITIAQAGLNTFWTPFVYEYRNEQTKIQKMHHIVAFLLLTCGFAIIALQDLLYILLVDEKYWGSRAIMGFLMISPISETISETLGLGIELSKKTYLKFPVYFISILVNVASCLVLIPKFGVVGAAVASAVSSLVMLAFKAAIGERYYKCGSQYWRLILCMGIFVVAALVSFCFDLGPMKVIASCAGIAITVCVYFQTTMLLLKNSVQIKNRIFHKEG